MESFECSVQLYLCSIRLGGSRKVQGLKCQEQLNIGPWVVGLGTTRHAEDAEDAKQTLPS
jgi:hypothetical protein